MILPDGTEFPGHLVPPEVWVDSVEYKVYSGMCERISDMVRRS